jgi:hypothetical protein
VREPSLPCVRGLGSLLAFFFFGFLTVQKKFTGFTCYSVMTCFLNIVIIFYLNFNNCSSIIMFLI